MNTDYQWPYLDLTRERFVTEQSPIERRDYLNEIETYFSDRLGVEAVLVPSGRAAISMILDHHNFSRRETVFAPKWSSHCVWDVLTRYANPTVDISNSVDGTIAVHKWGQPHKLDGNGGRLLIEDSVDSLFVDGSPLFVNDGRYEIVSLPKVMGVYTGGLILTESSAAVETFRDKRNEGMELGIHQSKLRYLEARGDEPLYESWRHLEYENTFVDMNAASHIQENIQRYEENRQTIESRLEEVRDNFDEIPVGGLDDGRLPPVLAFPCSRYNADESECMIRHANVSRQIDDPEFVKSYLLPLHFGVDDKKFNSLLRGISRAKN